MFSLPGISADEIKQIYAEVEQKFTAEGQALQEKQTSKPQKEQSEKEKFNKFFELYYKELEILPNAEW